MVSASAGLPEQSWGLRVPTVSLEWPTCPSVTGNGGPNHWECWMRDPDGYIVVVASPYGSARRLVASGPASLRRADVEESPGICRPTRPAPGEIASGWSRTHPDHHPGRLAGTNPDDATSAGPLLGGVPARRPPFLIGAPLPESEASSHASPAPRRPTYFGFRSSRVTVWKAPACCSALAISNPVSLASRL